MVTLAGFNPSAARRTYSRSGWPEILWSTLGRADFIRVPLPAASTTTWRSFITLLGPFAIDVWPAAASRAGGFVDPLLRNLVLVSQCRHRVACGTASSLGH